MILKGAMTLKENKSIIFYRDREEIMRNPIDVPELPEIDLFNYVCDRLITNDDENYHPICMTSIITNLPDNEKDLFVLNKAYNELVEKDGYTEEIDYREYRSLTLGRINEYIKDPLSGNFAQFRYEVLFDPNKEDLVSTIRREKSDYDKSDNLVGRRFRDGDLVKLINSINNRNETFAVNIPKEDRGKLFYHKSVFWENTYSIINIDTSESLDVHENDIVFYMRLV